MRPVLFELRDVDSTRGGRAVLDVGERRDPDRRDRDRRALRRGKSTLLRLLNRLADPDRGEIAYRERPLREYDPLALRREVALVPQLPALLEGTVDRTSPTPRARRQGARRGPPPAPRRPRPRFAERDVAKLSVGEQQRAMLARALAQGPAVLLLDEPTAALDHAARDAIEATLATCGASWRSRSSWSATTPSRRGG